MKPKIISAFILLVFFFMTTSIALSQNDSTQVQINRIELTDGSILVGKILSEDDVSVRFKTQSGTELTIKKDQIKKREVISGKMVQGELWRNDPNQTRLLFAPTGKALKSGQGYFSVYEIFFPFIAVGITDYLTLAGGFSLVPGAESQLLYLAPKITPIHLEKFDLAAGVLYMKVPEEDEGVGIIYSVGTYGNESVSFTLGLGFAFAGGEVADKPVFALGLEARISKSTKFITENWLIPDSEVQLISAGIRFFGENLAADFALIYPAGADPEGFPFIPWIGFAYNFGGNE